MQALLRFASKGVLLHKVLHGLGADPSPPLSHPFSHTQIVALLYYVLSYFPGGTAGVRFAVGMLGSTLFSCFGAATSAAGSLVAGRR